MNISNMNPGFVTRIRQWVRTHKIVASLIGGGVLLLIGGLVAFALLYQKPTPEAPKVTAPAPKPAPVIYYSPLDGTKIPDEAAKTAPVTAIMIENSPSARPQSGIKDAGVVYEAVAEGGITRFLALYQNQKPEIVGPVRSLRMYYVDWLAPYNASVAHVGGSLNALNEIRNGNYRDLDQFFNDGAYWRASDRYAPHNVYTNFENLDALNNAKGYTESTFTSFRRVDGAPVETPDAASVSINFSSALYNTAYSYNKATNSYLRSLGGEPHLDREEGQVTPSVIIALRVNMYNVMEDGYREHIDTIGSGSAVIFQNGTAEEVTWHKKDRGAPLVLTDKDGKEVSLARGQTWIAAVPAGGSIAWQ